MVKLENNDLLLINGGGLYNVLKSGLVGLVAAGVFVASIIYGYIHPEKCK